MNTEEVGTPEGRKKVATQLGYSSVEALENAVREYRTQATTKADIGTLN